MEPAIAQTSGAFDGNLFKGAKPNWNWPLHGQWVEAGFVNIVPFTFEIDDLVRPQGAHELDLFFEAPPPVFKILVQRVVFHFVPADADP